MSKRGQRTKGNVKPASSDKAAAALLATGAFATVYGEHETEADVSGAVDSELRVVLKKMSKRDACTKQKALAEWASFVDHKSSETLTAALPEFLRAYSKLSTDNNRLVREGAQRALEVTAAKVGRNLALHMKLLMPHWLLAMNDVCDQVSTGAQVMFPLLCSFFYLHDFN